METEVLNSKQGDCLGKSDILARMLLAYGYSSREVIVSMGYVTRNDERRHHAWVELNSKGKWIVLDPSQFLGNFEFDRWDKASFYQAYQAQPYAEFNDRFVQVMMDSNG
ncbi:MAG: transglutaminase domain-containing protein [Candidatus Methanoperedens sp.]|nr:transglutaminase domain-containing protein [Candidatus Methanoperedens sp.]